MARYGVSARMTFQLLRLTPPSSQLIAWRSSPVDRSIRYEVNDVAKDETATPAKIKLVTGTLPPTRAKV